MQRRGLVHIRATAWLDAGRLQRVAVLWLMLLALPVQGVASLLAGWLGASHHHVIVPQGESNSLELRDFRRLADAAHAGPARHGHSLWVRHHHATGDPTVVALDDATADPARDSAGSGAAQLTLCTPGACVTGVAASGATRLAWPGYRGQAWDGPAAAPLERPPKA